MLKRDPQACFVPVGFWGTQRRFRSSGALGNKKLSPRLYGELLVLQQGQAIPVLKDSGRRRVYWMYQDEFYWEDEGLSQDAVQALVAEQKRKRSRQVARAVAVSEVGASGSSSRERIADDVQIFVWNRDGGRCVRCGSQDRLEFDHIIPVSRGGANTARNIQLLCESCNRSKGSHIGS